MIDVSSASAITVEQVVQLLSLSYSSLVKSNTPFRNFPAVMLWGPPGVGKSQGIKQVAEKLAATTGRKVSVTDVRLLMFNPVDLRGIPTANADKTLAVWLKPQIFQMDNSDDVINILFLDEISAAPPSVQAAAYQITLDRKIGEHTLPENCIVVAAGNRTTDKSVAYSMPKALANRLCHFEICSNYESWHKWAMQNNIHGSIIGYLDFKPNSLTKENLDTSENAFPTPRTWEMVSNILTCVSKDLSIVYPMVVGCIGEEAASDFREWYEIYQNVPPVDKIFKGTHTAYPRIPAILFALSAAIVEYAGEHHSQKEIDTVIKYICQFPVEYRNKIFQDFLHIKAAHPALKENELYNQWFTLSRRKWEHYGL